jgi:two-component system sensor histidine kinase DesK
MVVKESLNNIIKHSNATQVEIESSISNSDFMITIKDNGTGVSEVTNLGNGIKNMRNRVESLNGQFSINNNTGSGTIIKVNIPLNTILKF